VPIYEYYCTVCGNEEEVLQSLKAPPLICRKESKGYFCNTEMKKRISKSAVIFKGSGFYETDYKKKPDDNKKEESVSAPEPSNNDSES
jgi:putative FmdB family regulatory protein